MSFDPVAFLEDAVRTPSHDDVTEMRDLLVETLEAGGVVPRVDQAGNTLAVRESGESGPHVVLNTHIDTVPPHVEYARDSGDVIRGRGACDAKGPLAALLAAFLRTDPERGRVTLAVTPDEETETAGARALSFDPDPDAFVVGEPTELDVCTAAKGRFQATVEVAGASAHAAEPESGVNAVRVAGDLLSSFDDFGDREGTPDPTELLGAPTLTPTTVEGGSAANQVPATCSVVVDRRSVPPETPEGFRAALEAHLRERAPDGAGVDVSLPEWKMPFLEAFETPADAEIVRALAAASGGAVRPFGAATEAAYFADRAPTVVFGPGALADDEGAVAHAPREYVRASEVERAAEAVETALSSLVG
ncbi:M20/M25/M40 family metallo-hydrolase [Halorussus marinus]|uniref:M20/M25/M40 family metallo-hydrolase n=1 Tax=Halorussus marinus TaxID=2505976 RepID=UPI00106EE6FA|nr:M20/M25/M40 family metallo-hydrolase [Halorussus marinus]